MTTTSSPTTPTPTEDPSELQAVGLDGSSFARLGVEIKPRLILAIDGLEKQGKTHFAFTAPGPIAYQSIDIGEEGVISKFPGKQVFIAKYRFNVRTGLGASSQVMRTAPKFMEMSQITQQAEEVYNRFYTDFHKAIRSNVRTIIWDTASEVWELLRMARYGKLTEVKQEHHGPIKAEMRELIREAYDSDCNLILLHKLKSMWIDNQRQYGKYERQGMPDMGFLVQCNATVRRDRESGLFSVEVTDCRQNASLMGLRLEGDNCCFPMLASMVFQDVPSAYWGNE